MTKRKAPKKPRAKKLPLRVIPPHATAPTLPPANPKRSWLSALWAWLRGGP